MYCILTSAPGCNLCNKQIVIIIITLQQDTYYP